MPGRTVSRIRRYDPGLHAPARYRRTCGYEAFMPDEPASIPPPMDGKTAGRVKVEGLQVGVR